MTIVVTSETGGRAQPTGVTYVLPDRQVLDGSSGTALADAGVNAPFVADLLSACLAHERCGTQLYRSVAGRTAYAELQAQYEHFGEETQEHVEKLEQLVLGAGGDPQYVSASARATENAGAGLLESTYLLSGSVDPVTAELAMLEAVLLAETKDRGNWMLLAQLAAEMPAGDMRARFEAATSEVLEQEEEHYTWASDTRARLLLSMAIGTAEAAASEPSPADVTREDLYARAQELDIPGRSQMNKEELQAAIEENTGGAS